MTCVSPYLHVKLSPSIKNKRNTVNINKYQCPGHTGVYIYRTKSLSIKQKRIWVSHGKKKKKTKTKQTKPKQIISIFEFEAVQDSREQFSSFGKETPSCIPTVTNVSKDLALLARRSSSSLIESCNTCHVKGKVGGADAGTHLGI